VALYCCAVVAGLRTGRQHLPGGPAEMLERFTDEARGVVVLAQEEARVEGTA
jgi:hypothetical protein